MQQFAVVVREVRKLLLSIKLLRTLLPYHQHILFGSLGVLFLEELLYRSVSYSGYDTLNTLFFDIPLHLVAYYGFFVGLWLTLISPNVKYLAYGLWFYAFLALFPFEYLRLAHFVQAAIYAAAGYGVFRYAAISNGPTSKRTLEG
ncbi:hypothetical protein [Cohnella boryungensis]|uniref:Uncharacterized protein n=1 Tax=Cohnella boryungensis TaxID=768479 RepID=A0ABV8S7P2_9BACL